jgi:hypothetical protein
MTALLGIGYKYSKINFKSQMKNLNHSSCKTEANNFRAKYLSRFFVLSFLTVLTAWNFFAGFIILLLRQAGYGWFNFILASFAGVPFGLLISALLLKKVKITEAEALAVLDNYNKAGGLLLAISETSDTAWIKRLPQSFEIPKIKVNFNRRLPALIVSVVFLIAGMKVPLINFSQAKDHRMELTETEEKAILQIETLEETDIIDENEAEDLKETMKQIIEKADKNAPSRTFEAFDQMKEKLKNSAQKSLQKAKDEQSELDRIDKLNRDLESALESGDSKAAKSIAQELNSELKKSGAGQIMDAELKNNLSKALESFSSAEKGAKESLKKAGQELKQYIQQRAEEIRKNAGKLQKARLVDRKTFEELMKQQKEGAKNNSGQPSNQNSELIIAPADQNEKNSAANGRATKDGKKEKKSGKATSSGDGGISIGGGSAPLNYNRKTSEHNMKYKDEKLPDPNSGSIEDSVAIGVGISAPMNEETALTTSQGTKVDFKKPAKSRGQDKILLPRHRNSVKRYFSND